MGIVRGAGDNVEEQGGSIRLKASRRMMITVWALPLAGFLFLFHGRFSTLHIIKKYLLIGVAIACVPFLRDLLELVTGVGFSTMAAEWDHLEGWQRGVIGLGVVAGVLILFAVVVTQILYP